MATPKEMREWLRLNGIQVGDRGRLHPNAVRKYEAAHGGFQTVTVNPAAEVHTENPAAKRTYYPCGWCATGEHEACLISVRNGTNASSQFAYCKCAVKSHKE